MTTADLARLEVVRGLPTQSRVVRSDRMIIGARAMQLGPLTDGDERPWKIDRTTLTQMLSLLSAKDSGVKMRFAHPNLSNDGMGRHVGRAINPRIVEDGENTYLAVDCRLASYAEKSPNGNLTNYILDVAEEDPEVFGLSAHPRVDHEAMEKIEPDEQGLRPLRVRGVRAIDFVDDPASTRGGLLSTSRFDLAANATDLLDTYFADATSDEIQSRFGDFLTRYLTTRKGSPMATTPKSDAAPAKTPAKLGVEEDVAAMKAEIAALKAEIAAMKDDADEEGAPAPELESEAEKKPEEGMSTSKRAAAAAELKRIGQIESLCKLAGVDDAKKRLMIDAGFSRSEAQQYLSTSGFLGAKNPPIGEDSKEGLAGKKLTDDEKFGVEYDEAKDIFERQGVTRDAYIKSRKKG